MLHRLLLFNVLLFVSVPVKPYCDAIFFNESLCFFLSFATFNHVLPIKQFSFLSQQAGKLEILDQL